MGLVNIFLIFMGFIDFLILVVIGVLECCFGFVFCCLFLIKIFKYVYSWVIMYFKYFGSFFFEI